MQLDHIARKPFTGYGELLSRCPVIMHVTAALTHRGVYLSGSRRSGMDGKCRWSSDAELSSTSCLHSAQADKLLNKRHPYIMSRFI